MDRSQGRSGRQRSTDAEQLVDVATRFYLEGRSQTQIARSLNLDPSTVSRLLKRARDEGVVRIEIGQPQSHNVELGLRLAEVFELQRAIVVASEQSGEHHQVAAAAARLVDEHLRTGTQLGISWGRTLAEVVRYLTPGTVSKTTVTQLAGGLSGRIPGIQGHELVRRVSELYPHSRVHYLHAPAIVDSPLIRKALVSDRSIDAALMAGAACDVALVGVGAMDSSATLVEGGHLGSDELALLEEAGAVGNLNVRFFGRNGDVVPVLDDRTVGITIDELRRIPTVVAVAAGREKVEAVAGALRTRCVEVLVTDVITAKCLLDLEKPSD